MTLSIFLSHTAVDKPFVRRLVRDLGNQGLECWIDEVEIKVGESLLERILNGIASLDYVGVILSPDSVASDWVLREIDLAMEQEMLGCKLKVLPILYRRCNIPTCFGDRHYADFTDEASYPDALRKLVMSIGIVFNKKAVELQTGQGNLGTAIDKASGNTLVILSKPFHRPFQYMGLTVQDAARAVGGEPNQAGNIIVESEECHMFLEAEGNFINYVEIELKRTAPHRQDQEFDSEVVLGALSINPEELELVDTRVHYHSYYDHRKRLKIGVSCSYDGGPLSVGFSSKYYGM